MRLVFSAVVVVVTLWASAAVSDPLPNGFTLHDFNASQQPVTEDGVTTFHIVPDDCSDLDYGDGRGESDCSNGNTKSNIRQSRDARLGETLDYSFDIWVDSAFAYPGEFERDAVPFRPRGWDSRLRIASWEGPFIKNFIYMLKLDATDGITFFAEQCQAPDQFGEWVSVSLKVHWANNDKGWVKVTCGDRIIYAREGASSTAQLQCYLANECQPGVTRDPKEFNFILGLAMNGRGEDWEKNGFPSRFTVIPPEGLTIKMRNISVTKGADLYAPEERAVIVQLQEVLNALGCDVGAPDGIPGKRTKQAALSCKKFADGVAVPSELNVATAQTFLELYRSEGVADLPAGSVPTALDNLPPGVVTPKFVVRPLEIVSRLEGSQIESEYTIFIENNPELKSFDFSLFGSHNVSTGRFNELSFFLSANVELSAAIEACPGSTLKWPDGSHHALLRFVAKGDVYVAPTADCLIAALPKEQAAAIRFLTTNFADIAVGMMVDGTIDAIQHEGVKAFMRRVAMGEITVGK